MNPQHIKDMLDRRPFVPFRVVTSSGQSYDIRHPEMALVTKNTLFVGINSAGDTIPEDGKIVSILHVTGLEALQQVA